MRPARKSAKMRSGLIVMAAAAAARRSDGVVGDATKMNMSQLTTSDRTLWRPDVVTAALHHRPRH